MYNNMSGLCVHCHKQHDVHIIRNSTIYASGRRVVYWQRYEMGLLVGHYDTWTQALIGVYPFFWED